MPIPPLLWKSEDQEKQVEDFEVSADFVVVDKTAVTSAVKPRSNTQLEGDILIKNR
jgi:hypothetical protein